MCRLDVIGLHIRSTRLSALVFESVELTREVMLERATLVGKGKRGIVRGL